MSGLLKSQERKNMSKDKPTAEERTKVNPLEQYFKIPGSRRERAIETETFITSWLYENGQRVHMLSRRNESHQARDILSPGSLDNLDRQMENSAIDYVEGTLVKSYNEGCPEAFGAQDLWGKMIANFLKPQPLNFLAKIFTLLKERPIPLTLNGVNLSDYLFKELEADLKEKYSQTTPEKQKEFKQKLPYEIDW